MWCQGPSRLDPNPCAAIARAKQKPGLAPDSPKSAARTPKGNVSKRCRVSVRDNAALPSRVTVPVLEDKFRWQSTGAIRMQTKLKALLGASALFLATQAAAQITFYEGEGFRGGAFSVDGPIANFDRTGFNDRASSAIVEHGRWEVCEDAGFNGRCTVLRPG